MKYILGGFIVFIISINLSAQQDLTLFQFSGIPQNNLVNPAQLPDDKLIIGLPLLSSVNSVYNNRTFTCLDYDMPMIHHIAYSIEILFNAIIEDFVCFFIGDCKSPKHPKFMHISK